MKKQLEQAK